MKYIKSPLNYHGGKYKLLPEIMPHFPKDIGTFVDLFGGGFNVGINIDSAKIVYNDINEQVEELLNYLYETSTTELLKNIHSIIDDFELNKTNKNGYMKLREFYNAGNRTPLVLYVLICHSFNNQIRFNKKGEFNLPFGEREFNPILEQRFVEFADRLHELHIEFRNKDFNEIEISEFRNNDFIYCDPPYLISKATYNENGQWNEKCEQNLLNWLDSLDRANIKFALSNLLQSKGKSNDLLKEWSKKYNIHYINSSYRNCNYQRKSLNFEDLEVLITNY